MVFLLCISDSGADRPPIPVERKKWTDTSGFTGRIVPDSVDGYFRIQWTLSAGFGGRFRPDYAPSHQCIFKGSDVSFSTIAGGAHLGGILVCLDHSPDFTQNVIQVEYSVDGTDRLQKSIAIIINEQQIWRQYRRKYVPSPKHAPGGGGTLMDLDEQTAQHVLDQGIGIGRQIYGYHDSRFYEFQNDNVGGFHGYPVREQEMPPTVKIKLREKGIA